MLRCCVHRSIPNSQTTDHGFEIRTAKLQVRAASAAQDRRSRNNHRAFQGQHPTDTTSFRFSGLLPQRATKGPARAVVPTRARRRSLFIRRGHEGSLPSRLFDLLPRHGSHNRLLPAGLRHRANRPTGRSPSEWDSARGPLGDRLVQNLSPTARFCIRHGRALLGRAGAISQAATCSLPDANSPEDPPFGRGTPSDR